MADSEPAASSTKKPTRKVPPEDAATHPTVKHARCAASLKVRKHHPHDDTVTAGLELVLPALPIALVQDFALNRRCWCQETNILEITEHVSAFNMILDINFSLDSTELVVAVKDGLVALAISEQNVEDSGLKWENGGASDMRYDSYGCAQHPDGKSYASLFEGDCEFRSASSGEKTGASITSGDDQHHQYIGAGFTSDGHPVLYDGNSEWQNDESSLFVFVHHADGTYSVVLSLPLICNAGTLPISCDNKLVARDKNHVGGIWDLSTGTKDCTIPWNLDCSSDVVWSKDGTMVAMATDPKTVEVFRMGSLLTPSPCSTQEPLRIKGSPYFGETVLCCFTPDNRSILTYSSGLKQWDARTGQLCYEFPDTDVGNLYRICCSPNGKWIAGHEEEKIYIWDFSLMLRLRH